MKTIETFLPAFTGFYENPNYNTDFYEIAELDYINDEREKKGLSVITIDNLVFNYAEYYTNICIGLCNGISKDLRSEGFVSDINFKELVQPREYNFENDRIKCEVILSDDNIRRISEYMLRNSDEFSIYLSEHFTARSGFIPFYSNCLEVWINQTKNFTEFETDINFLNIVLEFICQNEKITEDNIEISDLYLTASNFEALTTK